MIYGVRSKNAELACTRIEYRGFEISIGMDDGHRGGDLRRVSILVYKNDQEVTGSLGLKPETRGKITTTDGLVNPTGDDLFNIMEAINQSSSS